MKIILAPDSYKGSLTALEVAEVMEDAIHDVLNCEIIKIPMSDGGDGAVDAVASALNAQRIALSVHGPLGKIVTAEYAIFDDTAVIEMASASGIILLRQEELNPMKASTYGTGELILDAIARGCKKIIMCIGGSATNDGGMGMAEALGVKFFDNDGNILHGCGASLRKIKKINFDNLKNTLKDIKFTVACDVTNPLYGENGASYVFAKQKGADVEMIKLLDNGLRNFSEKIKQFMGKDISNLPGAGAAGGLGGGLSAFCSAELKSGFSVISEAVGLEEKMKGADLVITGEGRTDSQTAYGKLPQGVGTVAKKLDIPCVIISGSVQGDVSNLYNHGITAVFSSVTSITTLDVAISQSRANITSITKNVCRLFGANK